MDTPLHRYKADFFKTLGHPIRLAILDALREGELSVGELQTRLEVDQSSLSQHLSKLRAFNFVGSRKDGTMVFYHVHDQEVYLFLNLARGIYERQLLHSTKLLDALKEHQ